MFEVYKKEIKELLRDRKTLMFVVALPIFIFPMIFGVLGYFMVQAQIEADQEVHNYSILGTDLAKDFSEDIFYHKNFKLSKVDNGSRDNLISAVKNKDIDVGINIQRIKLSGNQNTYKTNIEIIFNNSSRISYISEKIRLIFVKYKEVVQRENLKFLGITKDNEQILILSPVTIEEVDTADLRESFGEKIGVLLPYLLIPLVLTGASYPAIDLGAGEKERGTLETLLLTPITRTQIVLGKFLTIFTASMTTSLITVGSMGLWIILAKWFVSIDYIIDAIRLIGINDLLLILILLMPLACIFSSIVLAISIYSKSFKEAQNYMGPLSMLVFVPLAISMMPNMELTLKTSIVPVLNVSIAIRELLKGTVDYNLVYLIVISTTGLALICLSFCVKWFKKEDVLFR
ncbi:ABC transporter permease subunit [Pseudoalteromonas sp. TB64]|uniref:ABC transporter permease subunit n=1 Tax=Pseudoalteromonas sp. TB64 TaxID=1938600 RepID=UPI00040A2084|nr:ABC transporter permease subunit [Pseudoalteromonas sp. TB64]